MVTESLLEFITRHWIDLAIGQRAIACGDSVNKLTLGHGRFQVSSTRRYPSAGVFRDNDRGGPVGRERKFL